MTSSPAVPTNASSPFVPVIVRPGVPPPPPLPPPPGGRGGGGDTGAAGSLSVRQRRSWIWGRACARAAKPATRCGAGWTSQAVLGGVAVATRARRELEVAGGRPRSDRLTGSESLTPAELRVATLAAGGLSNPQIAGELFLTRKTVEWHLQNVYRKLEIGSRAQLADALGRA